MERTFCSNPGIKLIGMNGMSPIPNINKSKEETKVIALCFMAKSNAGVYKFCKEFNIFVSVLFD